MEGVGVILSLPAEEKLQTVNNLKELIISLPF